MATPYQFLAVDPRASYEEIRLAYLDQACKNHPSKQIPSQHPAIQQARFRRAAEAFVLISNDSRRQISDLALGITDKGHLPNSSLQPIQGQRHRSSSEATGTDPLWNFHTIRDRLPTGLRTLLAELDPIKVFNRVLIEIDNERQQKLSPPTHLPPYHLHPNQAFRKAPSPEHHRPAHRPPSRESQPQGPRRERPASILSASSSSAGKLSPRNSIRSSHQRRVSFTDQTIANDELKKFKENVKAESIAFSNLSLYQDQDRHQGMSSSVPSDAFITRKPHSSTSRTSLEHHFPWSSLHFDDPRLLGGSKGEGTSRRPMAITNRIPFEPDISGESKTRVEEEIQKLCKFLHELDPHGAFDEEMAQGIYEGGVRKKEALLEMSKDEVCMFLSRLGMGGKLTAFQEATLPRKLEVWKAEHGVSF